MDTLEILKLKNILTFLNLSCGLIAIFFAMDLQFTASGIFLLIAVVFDYYDGKVARKKDMTSQFGTEIDSLADIVSFGVAPAVLVYSVAGNISFIILYIIFLVSGIIRLARYNITEKKNFFEGMPITCNGIIFPILILLKVSPVYLYIALLVSTFLMVSKIKFPKIP